MSASFDSEATEQLPWARNTEPPPTEILADAAGLSPTRPAKESSPPTIASPLSPGMGRQGNFETAPPARKTGQTSWIIGGLAVLIIIGIVFFIGYKMGGEKAETSKESAGHAEPNTMPEAAINTNPANQHSETPLSANTNQSKTGIGSGVGPGNSNAASSPETGMTTTAGGDKIFAPGEVDQKARIMSKPEPTYTEEARKNQVTGTVVLQVVLSESGEVTNIRAVSGLPDGLTERAMAAARQIRFTPAQKDGKAVSQRVRIEYNFNIY